MPSVGTSTMSPAPHTSSTMRRFVTSTPSPTPHTSSTAVPPCTQTQTSYLQTAIVTAALSTTTGASPLTYTTTVQGDSTSPRIACGDTVSVDCQSEYDNAVANSNLPVFCNRCVMEGGADPLRKRCSMC